MRSEATRVVGVADSDSYLKWGAATLAAMPADWRREQWLVTSPIRPSAAQIAAATDRPVTVRSLAGLVVGLLRRPPDVLLLACTGPVVQAVITALARAAATRRGRRRPVIVTGLPGISVPPTERAVVFRRGADLFLLHSRREVAEFTALAAGLGVAHRFGLARLPFVGASSGPAPAADAGPPTGEVVFAAQAKVPPEPGQRRRILLALSGLPDGLRGVVKVRAAAGEQQTHRELWSYPELWAQLVAEGAVRSEAVGFRAGSMAEALAGAAGLVTVSSTAALEAIAAGLPILVLDDFGVSPELINEVFTGSGCLGSLADLAAGRLRTPDPGWLADNYFHPEVDDDWTEVLAALLERRRAGTLPAIDPGPGGRVRLRAAVRLLLPRPVVLLARRLLGPVRTLRARAWDVGEQHPLADLPYGPGSG